MLSSERLSAALPYSGGTVTGTPEAVARSLEIDRSLGRREAEWVAQLRAEGIKAAHPDDGWVDRDKSRVHLCYPQFDDGLAVGDLLALGWPDRWRVVRITSWEPPGPLIAALEGDGPWYWHFEEARR